MSNDYPHFSGMTYEERIQAATAVMKKFNWNALGQPKVTPWDEALLLEHGRVLRDEEIKHYPILPGALGTFVDLASNREWAVAGKPKVVSRAVEALNNTESLDPTTGLVFRGLEQFTRRRAMDHVVLGRTCFAFRTTRGAGYDVLQYIDPTVLKFIKSKGRKVKRLKDNEKVWKYADDIEYRVAEIIMNHPLPVGTNRFVPPIYHVIPSAKLAFLLQEHNLASLDGRKIRDIYLVGNAAVQEAVENAIVQQAALWAGEDVSKIGIPVVHLNVPVGSDISKLFHRLGVSEVPDKFDPESFIDMFVNQISGALDLALRHFWNTKGATTNRSVEEVAERRQESKGPASFVRSEERLINHSGFLEQFGRGKSRPRFGYVEEIDVSTKTSQAEYLERVSKALNLIAKVFGASINMDAYLAWMQSEGVLPNDISLITPKQEGGGDGNQQTIQESDSLSIGEGETIQEGLDSPDAFAPKSFIFDYDEILMNGKGDILDRRLKTFSVFSVLRSKHSVPVPKNVSNVDAWDSALTKANIMNRTLLKRFMDEDNGYLADLYDSWFEEQMMFPQEVVTSAVAKCLDESQWETIIEDEQTVIDILVGTMEEWVEERNYANAV